MGVGRVALAVAGVVLVAAGVAGCGSSSTTASTSPTAGPGVPSTLSAEARPIGHGARFAPPVRGPILGTCRSGLGRRHGVHVELFAANRVVLIPAGIGARPPLRRSEGRISGARCYGALVTLDPTGVVLVGPGATPTVSALFASWGQPLAPSRIASFRGRVSAFVNGRPWRGRPGEVPLRPHAEIVLEVGPHVPPHASYTFPPGA